jgi:hypothetical protein
MKLHFPWPEVATALSEVRAATVVRPLYGKVAGKGLWLALDRLLPGPMELTRFLRFAVGIATALSGLHEKGVFPERREKGIA